MPTHTETRELPYSADQMFDLVADVARYPEFIPWTVAARIRSVVPREEYRVMDADLVVSFKVFRERFTSRVKLYDSGRAIDTEYLNGPFKYMISTWRFEEAEGGCRVKFHVDFEFRNMMLQGIIGVVFNEAMQRIVRAFEDRARDLYGPNRAT